MNIKNMKYKVAIKNNETQEIRIVLMDVEWMDSSYYWWNEGNYSCDCNRHLEFERVKDPNYDISNEELKCSEGKYAVLYFEFEDGQKMKFEEV